MTTMFIGTGTSITSIPNAVMRLKNIKDGSEFSAFLTDLRNF